MFKSNKYGVHYTYIRVLLNRCSEKKLFIILDKNENFVVTWTAYFGLLFKIIINRIIVLWKVNNIIMINTATFSWIRYF
jgi:hypothetical protein